MGILDSVELMFRRPNAAEKEYAESIVKKGEEALSIVFRPDQIEDWATHPTKPGSHWKSFFAKPLMEHFRDQQNYELSYIYADAGDEVRKRTFPNWKQFWEIVRQQAIMHRRKPARRPPEQLQAAE